MRRFVQSMRGTGYNPSVSSKRFRELQDEFFATSTRLQLAQKPEEKLALLNELQRIVRESKRALVDTDSKNPDFGNDCCLAIDRKIVVNRLRLDAQKRMDLLL
jgi:hypothetical protein